MATSRRGMLGLLTGGLAGFLFHREASPASSASAAQADDPAVGTWQLGSNTMVTLAPGGIFLRSGVNHRIETPGHGVWERTGDAEVSFTYVTLRFDAEGNHVGSRKSRGRFTLNSPDSFSGETRGMAFDREGATVSTTQRLLQGTRMVVEPIA